MADSTVRVSRIGDGDIGLRVTAQGAAFLILSENAYPGWRARIDGADVPIYRTDVTLQGVLVPAGSHRVDFTLESRALQSGMVISGISAAICTGLLVAGLARTRSTAVERARRMETI